MIELLVVISIISLLASIVLASLSSARTKAQDVSITSTVRQYILALDIYANDNGEYPKQADPFTTQFCIGNIPGTTCLSNNTNFVTEIAATLDPQTNPIQQQTVSGFSGASYASCNGNPNSLCVNYRLTWLQTSNDCVLPDSSVLTTLSDGVLCQLFR